MATCAFCGQTGKLTGEHVLGAWLSRIGLDLQPVLHGAGPLNRIGRDLGVRPPFRQTVSDVCGDCNNGWMSRLETTARSVLTPPILGKPGTIDTEHHGAIAAWTQKTALTAMLISSEKERDSGYGLPEAEYHQMYMERDQENPLPASQYWIGRYEGDRGPSIRVTPLAVRGHELPEPDQPHGYAITIVLGQLLLHAVRFTAPLLQVRLQTGLGLPQLWPPSRPIAWPSGTALNDETFLGFANGQLLRSTESPMELRPRAPATELAASRIDGETVELPTACGKHKAYYPAFLVAEAMQERFYAFWVVCECPMAYLIHTEPDGAHCKAAGAKEEIAQMFEGMPGSEDVIQMGARTLALKDLPKLSGRASGTVAG